MDARCAEPSEGEGDPAVPSIRASALLVDDTPANLTALAAILEPLDVRMVRAHSGFEALRCVLQEDFAVILMDVAMPYMDGLETAARIRARRRNRSTPIIFIPAARADAAQIARGYEQGGVDYLLKPYEPAILRSKVRVFVELHVQRQQIALQSALLRQRER